MTERVFGNADGEMPIVPQQGRLLLRAELGAIEAAPGEIAVVPRGVRFRAELPDGSARGYVCENYGSRFILPAGRLSGSSRPITAPQVAAAASAPPARRR